MLNSKPGASKPNAPSQLGESKRDSITSDAALFRRHSGIFESTGIGTGTNSTQTPLLFSNFSTPPNLPPVPSQPVFQLSSNQAHSSSNLNDYFNKFNHLSFYQQQQNILKSQPPPVNNNQFNRNLYVNPALLSRPIPPSPLYPAPRLE